MRLSKSEYRRRVLSILGQELPAKNGSWKIIKSELTKDCLTVTVFLPIGLTFRKVESVRENLRSNLGADVELFDQGGEVKIRLTDNVNLLPGQPPLGTGFHDFVNRHPIAFIASSVSMGLWFILKVL